MVSVLMPAFNRSQYIAASINSVLEQSYTNFELIITDDGSTDKTLDIIKQYTDERIKVLSNEKNMGIAFTRNKLMQAAKGDFIMLLDSDDIALPGRMQTQIDYLLKHSDVLLVGSSVINIDDQNKELHRENENVVKETEPEQIKAMLLFRNCLCQSSLMINKAQLHGETYDLNYPPYEDYELWCRLSRKHKLINETKPQVKYRMHATNVSTTTKEAIKMDLFNKISQQQFLYYFNYLPTTKELYTHCLWNFASLHSGYTYLADSGKWLKKIKLLNVEKRAFEVGLFAQTLKNNWYERCWYLAEKGYLFAGVYFIILTPVFSLCDVNNFFRLTLKSIINKFK